MSQDEDDDEEDDDDWDVFDRSANRLSTAATGVFREADRMFLIRLNPDRRRSRDPAPDRRFFHSWRVIQRILLRDPSDQEAVVMEVERGLASSDGAGAMCFDPTIAVRARRGHDRVDLVCCFDCGWVDVFTGIEGPESRVRLMTAFSPLNPLSAILNRARGSR